MVAETQPITITFGNLIERAKERCDLASDYAVAQRLGIHHTSFYRIRDGRCLPTDAHMVELTELAGQDPTVSLIWLNLQRSKDAGPARIYRLMLHYELRQAARDGRPSDVFVDQIANSEIERGAFEAQVNKALKKAGKQNAERTV